MAIGLFLRSTTFLGSDDSVDVLRLEPHSPADDNQKHEVGNFKESKSSLNSFARRSAAIRSVDVEHIHCSWHCQTCKSDWPYHHCRSAYHYELGSRSINGHMGN